MAAISPHAVSQVLSDTLSNDRLARETAEKFLDDYRSQTGFLGSLIAVIGDASVPSEIRTSAAVTLKNEIRLAWTRDISFDDQIEQSKSPNGAKFYTNVEKNVVRHQILGTYVSIPLAESTLRRQVEEAILKLILQDFPTVWPDPAEFCIRCLIERQNPVVLISGLSVLRRVFAKYELMARKSETEEQQLHAIVDQILPQLLQTFADLGTNFFASSEACFISKMICKLYYCITNTAIINTASLPKFLDGYMNLFKTVIISPIPESVLPISTVSSEQIAASFAMKAKKWAFYTLRRFYTRFASSKTKVSGADEAHLAAPFAAKWALPMLETLLQLQKHIVDVRSTHGSVAADRIITPTTQAIMLEIFGYCLELAGAYKMIKGHIEFLITAVVHPLLCYTEQDAEDWDSDPIEYVRRSNDVLALIASPREAAAAFLRDILRLRGKDFLTQVAAFTQHIFAQFNNTPPEQRHAGSVLSKKKDGALYMVGEFVARLVGKKRQLQIDNLLFDVILPELSGNDKFLKLRACWSVGKCLDPTTNLAAQEGKVSNPGSYVDLFKAMLACCTDPEMPIKVTAVSSVSVFFYMPVPQISEFIGQNILQIVDLILAVLENAEHEDAASTLEALVLHYADLMPPLAARLLGFLVNVLLRIAGKLSDDVNPSSPLSDFSAQSAGLNDENALMAVMHIARTVSRIVNILCKPQFAPVLEQVLPQLIAYLDFMMVPDQLDLIDETMEVLSAVTFFIPTFQTVLWKYYERLFQMCNGGDTAHLKLESCAAQGWAIDELSAMLPCFDNFFARDRQGFVNGRCDALGLTYKEMLIKIVEKAMFSYIDADAPAFGLQLIWLVMDDFVNHIDMIPDLVVSCYDIMWKLLRDSKAGPISKSMSCAVSKTLCTLAYATPKDFFALIDRTQTTDAALAAMTKNNCLTTCDAKKIFILAFIKIYRLAKTEPESVPPQLLHGLDGVLRSLAKETVELIKKKVAADREDEDSEEEWDTDSEQELEENQDAKPHHGFLTSEMFKQLRGDVSTAAADDDEDSEDEYEIRLDDSLGDRVSPLDAVNEMVVIQTFLGECEAEVVRVVGNSDASELSKAVHTEIIREEENRAARNAETNSA